MQLCKYRYYESEDLIMGLNLDELDSITKEDIAKQYEIPRPQPGVEYGDEVKLKDGVAYMINETTGEKETIDQRVSKNIENASYGPKVNVFKGASKVHRTLTPKPQQPIHKRVLNKILKPAEPKVLQPKEPETHEPETAELPEDKKVEVTTPEVTNPEVVTESESKAGQLEADVPNKTATAEPERYTPAGESFEDKLNRELAKQEDMNEVEQKRDEKGLDI